MHRTFDCDQAFRHLCNLFLEPWPGYVIIEAARETEKDHRQITYSVCLSSIDDFRDIPNHIFDTHMCAEHNFYFTCGFTDGKKNGRYFLRKKENITHIRFLWADIDNCDLSRAEQIELGCPCKPTGYVRSGGGYHFYWMLTEAYDASNPRILEALKRLEKWTGGDKIAKTCQILGLPGGYRFKPWKYDDPPAVFIQKWDPKIEYNIDEILVHKITASEIRVDRDFVLKHMIQGESFSDGDRSTRDFAIIKELIKVGHTKEEVINIFTNPYFACSEKAMERSGRAYLDLTFSKALAEVGNNPGVGGIGVIDDGRVVIRKAVDRKGNLTEDIISNFAITPLELHVYEEDETFGLIVNVNCNGINKQIRADGKVMVSSYNFRMYTGIPAISWTGNEADFQKYVAYIQQQLTEDKKFPATKIAGWFKGKVVVGKHQLGPKTKEVRYWNKGTCPNVVLNKNKLQNFPDFMKELYEHLYKLNTPRVSFFSFGWFAAALHAPQIRKSLNRQFPLLCLSGEPGSGKTTTAITLNRALCGVESDYTYEGTSAALRRIFSSTNCFPIFLDEYESQTHSTKIDAYLRYSWQMGVVPKCDRANNYDSVEDLPLIAPIVIGTITGVTDKALRDRMLYIRVRTHQRPKDTSGISWFRNLIPGYFARNWFGESHKEMIEHIKHCIAAYQLQNTEAPDRQAICEGVSLGILAYCNQKYWNGRWDWKDASDNADVVINMIDRETPENMLDILINYMLRNPGQSSMFLDREWKIELAMYPGKEVLVMHQSHFYAKAPQVAKPLQLPSYVTRTWLLNLIKDLESAHKVLRRSSNVRVRDLSDPITAIWLDLETFPLAREAAKEIMSDRGVANYTP